MLQSENHMGLTKCFLHKACNILYQSFKKVYLFITRVPSKIYITSQASYTMTMLIRIKLEFPGTARSQ